MASSSGTSSGSTMLTNSNFEEDLHALMDQRKRKRMISNRESARRSRMKKQKHVDDLIVQVEQLRKLNHQIMTSMSQTTQHYLKIEAENSVLRAQVDELSHRLQAMNEINCVLNSNYGLGDDDHCSTVNGLADGFLTSWSMQFLNQPVMASADMFQY